MSLPNSNERCFRQVLETAGIQVQIMTSHEKASVKIQDHRIVINAKSGPPVSSKSRVLKLQTIINVETAADEDSAIADPPARHAETVKAVHAALEDNAAGLVSLLNAARTTLGLQYTAFFIQAIGEVEIPVEEGDRIFRDAWGYTVTCGEQVST